MEDVKKEKMPKKNIDKKNKTEVEEIKLEEEQDAVTQTLNIEDYSKNGYSIAVIVVLAVVFLVILLGYLKLQS